jgi:hypothetical protein
VNNCYTAYMDLSRLAVLNDVGSEPVRLLLAMSLKWCMQEPPGGLVSMHAAGVADLSSCSHRPQPES